MERRIKPCDALYWLLLDLRQAAPTVANNGDCFMGWIAAAVDVLACVPDAAQRMSWAYMLAIALPPDLWRPGRVVSELLEMAKEVRAHGSS